jgi:hypothetical protein
MPSDLYGELFHNVYNFLPEKFLESIRGADKSDLSIKVQRYLNSDVHRILE